MERIGDPIRRGEGVGRSASRSPRLAASAMARSPGGEAGLDRAFASPRGGPPCRAAGTSPVPNGASGRGTRRGPSPPVPPLSAGRSRLARRSGGSGPRGAAGCAGPAPAAVARAPTSRRSALPHGGRSPGDGLGGTRDRDRARHRRGRRPGGGGRTGVGPRDRTPRAAIGRRRARQGTGETGRAMGAPRGRAYGAGDGPSARRPTLRGLRGADKAPRSPSKGGRAAPGRDRGAARPSSRARRRPARGPSADTADPGDPRRGGVRPRLRQGRPHPESRGRATVATSDGLDHAPPDRGRPIPSLWAAIGAVPGSHLHPGGRALLRPRPAGARRGRDPPRPGRTGGGTARRPRPERGRAGEDAGRRPGSRPRRRPGGEPSRCVPSRSGGRAPDARPPGGHRPRDDLRDLVERCEGLDRARRGLRLQGPRGADGQPLRPGSRVAWHRRPRAPPRRPRDRDDRRHEGRRTARIEGGLVSAARRGPPREVGSAAMPVVRGRTAFATGAAILIDGDLSIPRP